jgi:hypothetical protein
MEGRNENAALSISYCRAAGDSHMISRIGGCLRHQGLVATAARPRIVSQVKGKKAGLEIRGCDENWGDARSSMKKDSDTDTGAVMMTRNPLESLGKPGLAQPILGPERAS